MAAEPTVEDLRRKLARLDGSAHPSGRLPGDEALADAQAELAEHGESYRPVDLGPILDGTLTLPEPTIGRRSDGKCLFYSGSINGLFGDSGIGKSWITTYVIAQELRAGRPVMLIDYEDVPQTMVHRLRLLGVTDAQIRRGLDYLRPDQPSDALIVDGLVRKIRDGSHRLVVVDSVGEAFALEGLDENLDADVGPWVRRFLRPLADAGPAVVSIDHSGKDPKVPLMPSGSKRKRAAVSGAMYRVDAAQALGRGLRGELKLTVAKDRHGHFRSGDEAARFILAPGTISETFAVLDPPPLAGVGAGAGLEPQEVRVARAACEVAERLGRPVSFMALKGEMSASGFRARGTTVAGGIELAIFRGHLSDTPGPRRARMIAFVSPWQD